MIALSAGVGGWSGFMGLKVTGSSFLPEAVTL